MDYVPFNLGSNIHIENPWRIFFNSVKVWSSGFEILLKIFLEHCCYVKKVVDSERDIKQSGYICFRCDKNAFPTQLELKKFCALLSQESIIW